MKFRTLPATVASLLLGASTLGLSSCFLFNKNDDDQPDPEPPVSTVGKLNFEFENVVGSQTLAFGQNYTTLAGDQFKVSKFNYFVSNIKLTKADGTVWSEPESYHLVKQEQSASRNFELKDIPNGDYTRLTFTIGVDSARNTSGAQTGALDPLNDMFWGWSSGYIFLKVEGTSPQSTTGGFMYHVGGFRKPNNTIRTVTPALPSGTTAIHIDGDHAPEIHMQANLLKIFDGPNVIRFAQLSNTGHSSDPNSMKLADNYAAGMFSIAHIHPGN